MKCSQLYSDLFTNNIIQNKYCSCGAEETAFHFFFECPNYILHRNTLINETPFLTHLSIDNVLNGESSLSQQENELLHKAVTKFIIGTDRFSIIV